MKSSPSPSLAKGLLEAARHDGPSAARRSRIWEQVSLAPHLVVVAPAAAEAGRTSIAPAAKAALAGLSAGKMLMVGALVGSVMTVGAVTVGLFLMRAPMPSQVTLARSVVQPAGATAAALESARMLEDRGPIPTVPTALATPPAASAGPHSAGDGASHPRRPSGTVRVVDEARSDDGLLREAALVKQARKEIVEGHPADALDSLDRAGRDPSHSLEPEELSLRVRALRVLGRDTEADRVERALRTQYPDSVLLGK